MRSSSSLIKNINSLHDSNSAIEVSINFVIVVSFSLLILVMGLYLFTQVLNQGKIIEGEISEQVKGEIESLLQAPGNLVVFSRAVKEVERGKTAQFNLGIKADTKRCSSTPTKEATFVVAPKIDAIQDPTGNVRLPANDERAKIGLWHKPEKTITLTNLDKEILPIVILAGEGAESGSTYIFDVEILCNGQRYGEESHLIFLNVE